MKRSCSCGCSCGCSCSVAWYGPNMWCFEHFDFETCFAPHNGVSQLAKCSDDGALLAF